ncbi:MAG: AAA family ATPase, partial [Planctomycetota bacterium]
RDEAYSQLAAYMNLDPEFTHIGMFSVEQCKAVEGFINSLYVGGDIMSATKTVEPKANGSILSSIKPSRKTRPPRIVIAGTSKVGKSTFASGAPGSLFLPIDKEEGIDDVDVMSFPVAKGYDDVLQAMRALYEDEHKFKTLTIDSVSTLQPLVMRKAREMENVESDAKLGGGYGRQYDTPLNLWTKILTGIDSLRDKKGMASILVGHVTTTKFEDPIVGSYTQYELDLPTKIRETIYRWADVILFANWESHRITEEAGFNKKEHRGGDGGTRKLYTQRRASHPGGGRGVYGRLPYEMELSYGSFMSAVKDAMDQAQAA